MADGVPGKVEDKGIGEVIRRLAALLSVRVGPWALSDWLGLALLTALAALPRFVDLGRSSLWTDEFITRGAALVPSLLDAGHPIVIHNHPPGWGWAVWIWTRVAGDGEIGLRSLSALCGTVTPALIWVVSRHATTRRGAWIAATLVAVWPLHVHYSRQAEVYAFYGLLVLLQLWSFLALTRPGRPARWWAWGRHAAIVAVHIATFNLAAVFLVVENLLLWSSPGRREGRLRGWIPLQVAGFGGVALAAWWMRAQFEWYVAGGSPVTLGERLERVLRLPFSMMYFDLEQGMWHALQQGWLSRGSDLQWPWAGPLLWVGIFGAVAWIVWNRRARRRAADPAPAGGIAWLAYGLLPLLAYAAIVPEFRGVKAFLPAGFALALLLGEGIAVWGRWLRVAPVVLALVVCLPLVPGTVRVKREHDTIETRDAIEWLEARRGPVQVPTPGATVEPVVVHMGHMYCAVAYYAVPDIQLCTWPTQAVWSPGAPHGELRAVFFPVRYRIEGAYDEAGSYDIQFAEVFEGPLAEVDGFWLVLTDDRTFADPDRAKLRRWLAPYRVVDGAAFDGIDVVRLCRRGVASCDTLDTPESAPVLFSDPP